MKKYRKFASKVAKSGFYIILFLCISAIGISGYVMYLARDTKDAVVNNTEIESSLELPFSMEEEILPEMTEDIENAKETLSTTENAEPTIKKEEKKSEPKVAETKKEAVVYTMAVNGGISAPFSDEELVKSKTMGDWRIHSGVDIKGELGCEVRAIADGKVISVLRDSMMGNTVKIEHSDGLISIYANLEDEIPVKTGDTVKNGAVIGKIGNSALSECLEEPHLHLEALKDGNPIDPLSLYPAGEE